MESPEYWIKQLRTHNHSLRLDLRMCLHALEAAGIVDPYAKGDGLFSKIDEKFHLEVH
jgi:hypothetical protein